MKRIIVLFVYRTCSSYLMQVLRTCDQVYTIGDYSEVLTESEISKSKYPIVTDNLSKYCHDNLEDYLNYLSRINKNEILAVKISLLQIEMLIKKKDQTLLKILNDKETKVVILTRNYLDIYVSFLKAMHLNKFSRHDTTNMKTIIDCDHFYNWYNRVNNLYELIMKLVNNYVLLDYSEIENLSDSDKMSYIINKMNMNLIVNIDKYKKENFLFKQDKNKNMKDKIDNYDELVKFLNDKKLNKLLG